VPVRESVSKPFMVRPEPDTSSLTAPSETSSAGEPRAPRTPSDLEQRVAKLEARLEALERSLGSPGAT